MSESLPRLTPLPFAEAIAWARARRVVLPAAYQALPALVRAQAFTVAGLEALDQIAAIQASLADAIESGATMAEWQASIAAGDIDLPGGPARTETIFRNAVQQAYNRGRCEQQQATVASHPWWLYDAVDDDRVRPEHAAMDGMVARHDDPIWQVWTPSNGHRCRCRRIALSERQAQPYIARDRTRQQDPAAALARAAAAPDRGWETNVYTDPNAGLRAAIARRRGRAPDRDLDALAQRLDQSPDPAA